MLTATHHGCLRGSGDQDPHPPSPPLRLVAAVLFSFALALGPLPMGPSLFGQGPALAAENPDLSLEPDPGDSPALARQKAALRLMSAYTQVQLICEKCSKPQVMKGFNSANGSVLPKIVAVLRESGALNDAWKGAVDDYTDKAVSDALAHYDCDGLMDLINQDHWTLYRGRFIDDYRLINLK